MQNSLLRTKNYVPPYRAEWVPRPDLSARLSAGLHRKLILLSAPAGFGKTSLLAEWINHVKTFERSNVRVGPKAQSPTFFAWLSLDDGDNDASRFLAYLGKALESIELGGAQVDLSNLPLAQPLNQTILDRLINAVDEGLREAPEGSRVVLILDDYHAITAEPVHQSLVYFIEHLPPQMHLVIATRADPPLSLARLRARGEILELRASELRFSKEETREFLNRVMGLNLSEMDITALANRTEGWIAGLQMTALALQEESRSPAGLEPAVPPVDRITTPGSQTSARLSSFVSGLAGTNRYIMDYLVEEVIQGQPRTIQVFLLKTSILERMCGTLCDAVIDNGRQTTDDGNLSSTVHRPSSRILEELDRANLFVVPLDDRREWYRYHRLFADLLRKRLNLAYPGLVPDLHRRASEWFERNGALEEAVEHALAAKDEARAADLVARAAEGLMIRSEFVTLQRWLEGLTDEQIATRPDLCVFHAWTLFLGNSPLSKIEERLALIQVMDESQSVKAAPLRAYIAAFRGEMLTASAYARQALDGLPEEETFLRSMASIVFASCELSEGDPEAGYLAFEQAARTGGQTGNVLASVIALSSLAENYRKQGQPHQAEALYRQALDLSVDSHGKRLPIAGRALCGLGELMREWNRLEAAERYLDEGIELLQNWGALVVYVGYIALARLKQAQRNLPGAIEIIQKAQRLAAQTKTTPIDDWIAAMVQAALWTAHGDLDLAEAWAERRGLLQELDRTGLGEVERFAYAHLRKYELVVLARLRIAQGRFTEALQLLDSLLTEAIKTSRLGLRIEIQALRALALHSLGKKVEALSALETALSLTEPAGYVRLFLDEGDPMHRLLSDLRRQQPSSAYVVSLLAAFERENPQGVSGQGGTESQTPHLEEIEPLSEREQEVLALLNSRLTVPEMAEKLYVAESTVRSHIKSIYSKLDVHRRVDAVQRAEELGLGTTTPGRKPS